MPSCKLYNGCEKQNYFSVFLPLVGFSCGLLACLINLFLVLIIVCYINFNLYVRVRRQHLMGWYNSNNDKGM